MDTSVIYEQYTASPGVLCDRCVAMARAEVQLPEGRRLYFCAHHLHEHEEALLEAGYSFSEDLSL